MESIVSIRLSGENARDSSSASAERFTINSAFGVPCCCGQKAQDSGMQLRKRLREVQELPLFCVTRIATELQVVTR